MSDSRRFRGRMVWRELMTTDVERSKGFYGELLPWTFQTQDMGGGFSYTLILAGQKQIAGLYARPPEVAAPSHWSSYVAVDDVDAACASAVALGGKLLKQPMDLPNVGRMAPLLDPDGAVIWAFRGSSEAPPEAGRPTVGEFCWETLVTRDVARAKQYYGKVFGWQAQDTPMPVFSVDGSREGMVADFQLAHAMPPMWMTYVRVEQLAACRDRVPTLGGKIVAPQIDVPGVGQFAVVSDPTGAVLGLFEASAT